MQNGLNIFVDDQSVPLDIFLHLPNYRTQEICKIIPTNLVFAASDLCLRTMFIFVPECGIGHGETGNIARHIYFKPVDIKGDDTDKSSFLKRSFANKSPDAVRTISKLTT